MQIRQYLEQREAEILSPYACHSIDSKGRDKAEEECDIRPIFPQAEGQNTGISDAGRRPLQNKADAYAGGFPECENYSEGTAPE